MKTYFKLIVLSVLAGIICSCDDFLDVENYGGIPADDFITSVDNAQTALNGVYNGLYGQYLFYYGYYYYTDISTGELKPLKVDAEMSTFENYGYFDSYLHFSGYWKDLYAIVSRANDVCTKIYDLRNSKTLQTADNQQLDQMIGECNFLRGWAYFYLTRSFGDKLPSHPNYKPSELGVPISDTLIVKKEQLLKSRSTLKESWEEIIKDFETAYNYLPDAWNSKKLGAATKGAAAGYLGQVYMYLKEYDQAKLWFERAMQAGNYELVKDYAWNFDGYHENNSESVFEVQFQTTADYTVLASYLWRRLGADGQGFGMVSVNRDWVEKFSAGYELTQDTYDKISNEIDGKDKPSEIEIALREVLRAYQPYIGVSVFSKEDFFNLYTGDWDALGDQINAIRRSFTPPYRTNVKNEPNWGTANSSYMATVLDQSRAADPRMYDSFYVPGRDSIALDWAATNVVKYPNAYYGFKKYIPYNAQESWGKEQLPYADGFNSVNQRIFRLADLYLQYAEACYQTADVANATKYLNKVRRRAWKLPFDDAALATPEAVDYPTAQDSGNFMEALVAEREKELCLEGHLLFDYLRWNKSADLFKDRGFDPTKHHRLPIPLTERQIVGMNVLLQNDGY
jgi:hypothetical protein